MQEIQKNTKKEQYNLNKLQKRLRRNVGEAIADFNMIEEGDRIMERVSATNPGGLSDKLADYFAGNLAVIDTLETATGGTPFQREVWQALRAIPCGQVMHYGQLAAQLGRPGAARAVGAANGANPISIVVPCHRVIGRNGTLTGYAGGVQRKEWLLRHEGYLLL
ncbi:methylated-DNA--[protein]-cysteine S-methyltransferase [Salmonella enterica]|nr:methylated-DNA--[protein]-cysteine S-methyltransferase [Salmonella enterica]